MRISFPTFKASTAGLIAGLALVCWSGPAHSAEWYVDYEKGVEALGAGRFAEAVERLEKAVSARPEPGSRVKTYGLRFIKYYPYFHLGKAYLGLGDPQKAGEMFRASLARGELRGEVALGQELAREMARLEPPPAAGGGGEKAAEPEISAAERSSIEKAIGAAEGLIAQGKPAEARQGLSELGGRFPEGPAGDPYRSRVDEAMGAAGRRESLARDELRAGLDLLNRKAYDQARLRIEKALELDSAQEQARSVLARLEKEAATAGRQAQLQQSISAARAALRGGDLSAARQNLARAVEIDPASLEVRTLREAVAAEESRQKALAASAGAMKEGERLFHEGKYQEARETFDQVLERDPENKEALSWRKRAVESLAASMSAGERQRQLALQIQEARDRVRRREIRQAVENLRAAEVLDSRSSALAQLSGEVLAAARDKARQAVALRMQGQYARAMTELDDALPALFDRAAAHLHLAWACYARYLAEGEKDPALAERARSELRQALRLDPNLKPDPKLISPRLLAALEEARREPSGRP